MKPDFSNFSEDTKKLNPHLFKNDVAMSPRGATNRWAEGLERMSKLWLQEQPSLLTIVIPGQIRGGKNAITVTRTGARIPRPKWAAWRNAAVDCVRSQLPADFRCITEPVSVELRYVAGDRKCRDQPAIYDSIFHVLEKAKVVSNDALLWVTRSTREYDKANPRAEIKVIL